MLVQKPFNVVAVNRLTAFKAKGPGDGRHPAQITKFHRAAG
jgi:hypothetical protein